MGVSPFNFNARICHRRLPMMQCGDLHDPGLKHRRANESDRNVLWGRLSEVSLLRLVQVKGRRSSSWAPPSNTEFMSFLTKKLLFHAHCSRLFYLFGC